MRHTEQRNKFRTALSGSKCLTIPTVYDPLSARVAETVGYELSFLAGSVASNTTLAAPDLIVLTLTEFADQIRRIMRVSKLSLLVDADHGYGNALNVMRTIQELEHAGVSALTIEDTAQPRRFGQSEPSFTDDMTRELISLEEMVGKLRAAVAARSDPALVIVARTSALWIEDVERTVARCKAYAATGIDAIFLVGLRNLEQLDAVHAAVKLPVIAPGGTPATIKQDDLAARGTRIRVLGHQPLSGALKALFEIYTHLYKGGATADLKSKIISEQELEALVNNDAYKKWMRDYLS